MFNAFIIALVLLLSAPINAASMNSLFKSNEPKVDSATVQEPTNTEEIKETDQAKETSSSRAGTLFGNSSRITLGHDDTKSEVSSGSTSETGPKEASSVFGRNANKDAGAFDAKRRRASSVFGTQKATAANDDNEQTKGTAVTDPENPRSAPNYMWPVDGGNIVSFYGWRSSRKFHDGIDIKAPAGTNVLASKSGEVIYGDRKIRGYGNMIVIRHNSGYSTVYAHNKVNLVKKGDIVKQGDVIAHVGSTGHSSGPHSHFEVRKGKFSADPLKYLDNYDVKKHSGAYADSSNNPF